MIEQVPRTQPYTKRHLESVDQMLLLIDEVIGRAPEYNETGMVGVPLHAVLDWCMATPAGFAAFRNDAINAAFRRILRAWCEFLCSPKSLYVSTTRRGAGNARRPASRPASSSSSTSPGKNTGASRPGTITSPGASSRAGGRSRPPTTTR